MFRIMYVSHAARAFEKTELAALHAKARANNRRAGITGMLVYKEGWFVQVLEGEEAAVRRLFAIIQRDSRHGEVCLLAEGTVAGREFADWSMGFQYLNDSDLLGLYTHAKPLGKSFAIESFKTNPGDCLHLLRFIRDLQLTRA